MWGGTVAEHTNLCEHAHAILCEALLAVAQACVVDQDVQAARALEDGLRKGLDACLVHEVQGGAALNLAARVLGPAAWAVA